MNHIYRVFGLALESSSSIAGLESHSGTPLHLNSQPKVLLETGPQPDWVDSILALPGSVFVRRESAEGPTVHSFTLTTHAQHGGFELEYADGTRFVVCREGNRVWGTCPAPLTAEDLATYLLGPVMGFILRLRKRVSLHASALRVGDCGVVLVGDAGAGKSTTAAALALRGTPVCSEDIALLSEIDGGFEITPGYPRICLWPDSVEMLLGSQDALPLLTPTWEKRYLPLDGERGKFADQNVRLRVVYLFSRRIESERAPFVEELPRKEALLELVRNTYMSWLPDPQQRAREFDVLARLVDSVPVRRIVPHTDPRRIDALCERIIENAQSAYTK